MGLVHVILIFGTNNVLVDGLTAEQIHLRSIGSRLVLASRIFYAMFIWVSKLTVSEFLKRLARSSWKTSYERGLHFIRIFLLITFIAVVIATLTECQPFDHYWQVSPDPGPRCRQGFAQLITMGVADIITDILLVCWPIPIIVRSGMPLKRKLSLVVLFSLSLALIGITGTRVPAVISHRGRQQYRTVWASAEILASAAVANAVVLGSFVRDRGIKRNKYRRGSTLDSLERASTRRPTLAPTITGSDEDLFRAIGCRVPADLCDPDYSPILRPAPTARPASGHYMSGATPTSPRSAANGEHMERQNSVPILDISDETHSPHDSADALPKSELPLTATNTVITRGVTFYDIGGSLDDGRTSTTPSQNPSSPPSSAAPSGIVAHDFASNAPFPRSSPRNVFTEFSNRLSPSPGRRRSSQPRASGEREQGRGSVGTAADFEGSSAHRVSLRPTVEQGEDSLGLQDVGGLLR